MNNSEHKEGKQDSFKSLRFPLLLALTLGLAPFTPEPHIWGKIKWLWGGGVGMQAMDYFDVVLHGGPWLYLIYSLASVLKKQKLLRNKKTA